jgi:hypothetical protein
MGKDTVLDELVARRVAESNAMRCLSGAKARMIFAGIMYGLKPVRFKLTDCQLPDAFVTGGSARVIWWDYESN